MTQQTTHTALITGASRGLGLALARELATLGWTLILDGRGAEALEAARAELAKRTSVTAIPGDVADMEHRTALVNAVRAAGGLDALINNASTLGASPRPNLLDYPLAELEDVYRVNVLGPLGMIQALRNDFKAGARIISVTSDAGAEPYAGWGGYGSSKAALEHLTAILANEQPDWRVYRVDPGDMRTQMHQEAFPGEDISDRPLPEESVPGFMALLTGDLPSGRYQAQKLGQKPENVEVPPKKVTGLRVALTVSDFQRAVAFYRDGIGMPVLAEWLKPESNGVLFDAGQATLEIFDEGQASMVDAIEVGRRSAGPVRLALSTSDVAGLTAALHAQGAVSLNEPVLTPWGDLNQRIQTPDGIHPDIQLTLFEAAETEPEGAHS